MHVPGVVAQLIGMLVAASWLDTTVWQGPLSQSTQFADFRVFRSAGVYYVLARHSVPRETARQAPREAAEAAGRSPRGEIKATRPG